MAELRRILHAEDDEDIRVIAQMSLEALGGFELLQCENGAQALARAPDFAPDMFLMDVMMPEMDGPDAVRRLKETPEFAATPVVFVTAKASMADIGQLRSEFMAHVITKPFDPTALPDLLRSIWNGELPVA